MGVFRMSKMIYVCTEETMAIDLLMGGFEETEIEEKVNNIIQELKQDRDIFEVEAKACDYYIMGVNTALYLKLEYEITTMEREID